MRKYLIIFAILFLSSSLFATEYIDVIEKKDGSVFKGIIVENKINDFVKIELSGGSVFKLQYSDIDTIKKEKVNDSNSELVTGYDHFQITSMLHGVSLVKLKAARVDESLMSLTATKTKISAYNSLKLDDIVGLLF